MKIAIVNEWLTVYAGSEKVLEQLIKCFPDADLFAVCDFIEDKDRGFLANKPVTTSFIQKLPFAKKKYRNYLPLMPLAIEQLDVSQYDLIISSSHAVAKGVLTGPDQVHISYVHSPIRYAWDLQHQYLRESGLNRGLKGFVAKWLLHKMRIWDCRTANGVDHFLSNSSFIGRRIKKVYGRSTQVVYPPVAVQDFTLSTDKKEYYLTASRMVPYKKMDLIVEAFSKMPDKELIVIGTGPDFDKVKSLAKSNVKILGYQSFEKLKELMQGARAFVFAAEEDFGITPVEAQACGTPVIAFGKGGALETVKDGITGVFFEQQTTSSLIDAVNRFENLPTFDPQICREHAESFSEQVFRDKIMSIVDSAMDKKKAEYDV